MKAAIYSRKSKFTGKGESIENQIQLCRDYAKTHLSLSDDDIFVYEDEGFSGGTTDRPQFKLLVSDAKAKKFDVLICYRLDRISRNVADFSALMNQLEKQGVGFVSIREQFDTTTPMGRAMLYISSVFAQLERETIAERVRDNMMMLARTGRWLGGPAPYGYRSEPVQITDQEGKQRKLYKLEPVTDEAAQIRTLFEKYVELGSLAALETYCHQNDIASRSGTVYRLSTLRVTLQNPVYCPADEAAYEYLANADCELCGTPDARVGMMAYNKTSHVQNIPKRNEKADWIIATGAHAPVVTSHLWIAAQKLLEKNSSRSYRTAKRNKSLLSGLLYCSECGGFMRPKLSSRVTKTGEPRYYYACELKERSHGVKCGARNAPGNETDAQIIEQLKMLANSKSSLSETIQLEMQTLAGRRASKKKQITSFEKELTALEKESERLIAALGQAQNSDNAAKAIIERLESVGIARNEKSAALVALREQQDTGKLEKQNLELMAQLLKDYTSEMNLSDPIKTRALISALVQRIEWDGSEITIRFFGESKKSAKQLDMYPTPALSRG